MESFLAEWPEYNDRLQGLISKLTEEKTVLVVLHRARCNIILRLKNLAVYYWFTRSIVRISLNKNSNYFYIPRTSKHTDTCN